MNSSTNENSRELGRSTMTKGSVKHRANENGQREHSKISNENISSSSNTSTNSSTSSTSSNGQQQVTLTSSTDSNVINDQTLSRFIEIQAQIENYERQGVFDGLRLVEEDFERLEKSKRQAEINHKVLEEQTKKEKQDFENISQPTVQSFFKNKQAHSMAISKEQVRKHPHV